MPATGGSEQPAAPVPSTVPPDSEQVVLTEEDEIAELGAVPTADPDRVAEDEAADEGDLQPRQFLGATGDGLGGAEEPVHDDALPPEVSVSTAPASTPAATGCTPKAWQAKNLPAFKDKDNLTEEFLQHFEPFPKPKATPWVEQPADFRNTEQCDEEPQPTGPDWDPDCKGGLNMKFWHGMKAHGHDHERPTAKEIMDPLWLLFNFLPIKFWRNLANMSDNYQHQVYTRMQAADVAAGKDVVRRAWEKLFEAGRWSKLVPANMYTAHVLLCADFNEQEGYGYDSPHYLRPHSAKEFYRILGLKMMAYRSQGEYWFESDADRRAAKRRQNRQSA